MADPDLLGEYAVGSCPADQLFQQMVAEDSDDVAVSILLDCSGSMGNGPKSKAHLAKLTALALHQALSTCQIEHEITGFTTFEDAMPHAWLGGDFGALARENMERLDEALREAAAQGTDVFKFARCLREWRHGKRLLQVPLYGVFKSFGSTDARGLEHVAGLSHNLDGEAVLWQANRIAQRPEKRRVMFVLSDGNPEGSIDNAQGARYLKEAVQRVLASGIEIYGIGMDSAAVRSFYPEHWVCSDMQDLGRLAMTAMTDVLLRSRTERAWVKVA
jgi:cobalamin biosynthesis protein CobT